MALVRVTPLPSSRDANCWVVPRSFGRLRVTGPAVVLIVSGLWPFLDPSFVHALRAALVAVPAQELGHLGLEGGLEQEPRRQAGDLLEHMAEVTLGGEQLVNLCADALGGRYSCSHGCRSSFVELELLEGTYAR